MVLRESDAIQAAGAVVSTPPRDVKERGIAAPNPIQGYVDDALAMAASVEANRPPPTNPLK